MGTDIGGLKRRAERSDAARKWGGGGAAQQQRNFACGGLENISRRSGAESPHRGSDHLGVGVFTARGVTLSSSAVPWKSLKL